ncbi:MAG: hypothetical protein Q9221_006885 [Calogaya cf. arnoldii]
MSAKVKTDGRKRLKPVAELLGDKMVTIFAGRDLGWSKSIHHDVLCDRSAYFRAALQGQFEEATTDQIKFPEESYQTLYLSSNWLYTLALYPSPNPFLGRNFCHYIGQMCFARKILSEELQNTCIAYFRHYFECKISREEPTIVSADEISMVYDATPELPKLRVVVCLAAALQWNSKAQRGVPNWIDKGISQLLEKGGDFASDFAKFLANTNRVSLSTSSTKVRPDNY